MGQPLHDNLGDMAIWYAEKKFLEDNFKDTEVISFPEQNLLEEVEKHKDVITDEDVLFMQGGGNLGNQYLKCFLFSFANWRLRAVKLSVES